jgi:hypothetical protein
LFGRCHCTDVGLYGNYCRIEWYCAYGSLRKKADLPLFFVHENIAQIEISNYEGQRVVIKGCGDKEIDEQAFVAITRILAPVARAIMFGEACSSVPVFKKTIET